MSQSFWEPETVEKTQTEPQAEPAPADSGALALSIDDFSALEERIVRTVDLVKRERQARAAADQRAEQAESQCLEQLGQIEQEQKELEALRTEREQVRQRVERLLAQLDALEL